MINLESFASDPSIPAEFAALLRKRVVTYSPSFAQKDDIYTGLPSARLPQLAPHLRPQPTMTTCSAASASIVCNAARNKQGLAALTVADTIATDTSGFWARSVANLQCKGIGLHDMARLIDTAWRATVGRPAEVQAYPIRSINAGVREAVQKILVAFEHNPSQYLIVNFAQSEFMTDGFKVGHMSVVGGYDAERGRVAVLDVDVRGLRPYWVPFDRFLRGMNTFDSDSNDYRGLVVVSGTANPT